MTARMSAREQKAAKALALREQGLTFREIGERLGFAVTTVRELIDDPDGSKVKARKHAYYGGTCQSCGGPTLNHEQRGATPPRECLDCLTWTEEQVIDAMQRWAQEHGGIPPTAIDWRRAQDGYPSSRVSVICRIGWNELLLKAGFDLRRDCRPETQAEMERMIRDGVPTREIAEHFGWARANVHMRLRNHGTSITALRETA